MTVVPQCDEIIDSGWSWKRQRKCRRAAAHVEAGKNLCATHCRAGKLRIEKKKVDNAQKRLDELGIKSQWQSMEDFPMDGTVVVVRIETLMVWAPYDKTSKQFKQGVKGRWLAINNVGSWETAKYEPIAWKKTEQSGA